MRAAIVKHPETSPTKDERITQKKQRDIEMMERDAKRLSKMAKEIEQIEKNSEHKTELQQDMNFRTRVHYCCTDPSSSKLAFMWEWTLAALIFLSIAFYAFETYCTKPAHRPGFPSLELFAAGEIFFTFVFTLELAIRCAAAPQYFAQDPDSLDRDPPFFLDPLNVLDFVAVMPWFLETIFQPPTGPEALNLEFEIIKLLRVLRVFKIFRSFSGTAILVETATKSLKPLSLTLMMLFMFFTVVASMVFMLEPCASADCTFKDVYNTGYFLAITLTTVGYGDQIPSHPGARGLAILTMMFGAVFLSMPIAVIGNKFEAAYNNFEKRQAHKNPELALENAKKDYQSRLEQRRKRITHSMFSMLYDLQRVEAILEKVNNGDVNYKEWKAGTTTPKPATISEDKPMSNAENLLSGKSKYSVSNSPNARAKVMSGPAAEALTHLSRKHHFVSIDIRQLFRTNRVDKSLPKHIQALMKKITQTEDSFNTEVGEESDEEKENEDGHRVTQEASSGVQAFDLVQKNAQRYEMQGFVRDARARNSCRDKAWLMLEAHSSSRTAYRAYMFRWVMLGISVIVMMISTWPEFHAYSENSDYCKRLVVTYCKAIDSSNSPKKSAWIAANPGCFAAKAEELNVTTTLDYRGCLTEETCDFPSVAHNLTCGHGSMFDGCENHPDACSTRDDFRNSIYSNLMNGVAVCDRTPCVDNVNVPDYVGGKSAGDYSAVWGVVESILVVYFVLEYATRVVVARDPKLFCRSHIPNLIFTILLVAEFLLVVTSRKDWRYDAWGWTPFDSLWDTHTMRPLRIIVPLRFVAFSSDFRGIRVAMLTLERVAGRMMTPFLFFAVFMVLFAGLMYVFELLECKAMQVPDGRGNLKWYYMNQNEEDDCMVQDMFDAMWIIIVTMTSVGYGGRYPKSPMGKGIAIVAAIFGAFYMAMPLTIIGSTFYEIYVEQEETRSKIHLKLKLRSAAFKLARKTSFFQADNEATKVESGYERLCRTLNMLPPHAAIIDDYIAVERDDVHQFNSLEKLAEFKTIHHRATEILALYLHSENESQLARQHLYLASSVASGDNKIALSAFRQASAHLKDFDEVGAISPARSDISNTVNKMTPKTVAKVTQSISEI